MLRVASGISGVAGKSGSASGMTRGLSGIESRGVKTREVYYGIAEACAGGSF